MNIGIVKEVESKEFCNKKRTSEYTETSDNEKVICVGFNMFCYLEFSSKQRVLAKSKKRTCFVKEKSR